MSGRLLLTVPLAHRENEGLVERIGRAQTSPEDVSEEEPTHCQSHHAGVCLSMFPHHMSNERHKRLETMSSIELLAGRRFLQALRERIVQRRGY